MALLLPSNAHDDFIPSSKSLSRKNGLFGFCLVYKRQTAFVFRLVLSRDRFFNTLTCLLKVATYSKEGIARGCSSNKEGAKRDGDHF